MYLCAMMQRLSPDETAAMAKHETKICPRCDSAFECKVGDVVHCQCYSVVLSPEASAFLAQTHYDCLCANCLLAINQLTAQASHLSFPQPGEALTEGLHYYKEGGYWVFTELYHALRGHCCQSGCRHCAYGYRKQQICT